MISKRREPGSFIYIYIAFTSLCSEVIYKHIQKNLPKNKMVRFEEKLASNIVEEWAKHYLDYRRLKKLLYNPSRPSSPTAKLMIKRNSSQTYSNRQMMGSLGSSPVTNLLNIFRSPPSTPLLSRSPLVGARNSNNCILASSNISPNGLLDNNNDEERGIGYNNYDTISEGNLLHEDPVQKYFFEIEIISAEEENRLSPVEFRQLFYEEIQKVEHFYTKTLRKVEETFLYLTKQTEQRIRSDSYDANNGLDLDVDEGVTSNLHANESLRRAFSDSSKIADYLQNFCVLNFTAAVKILKKHDKVTGVNLMENGISVLTENKSFMAHVEIDLLIKKHEELYAKFFHGGNLDLAKAELLIKRNSKENLIRNTGARFCLYGVVLILAIWILWDIVVDVSIRQGGSLIGPQYKPVNMSNAYAIDLWRKNEFPVYRGMAMIVLWIWCWALSIHIWTEGRVNYLYMLELDPRDAPESTSIFETAARHTIVIFGMFLFHFKIMSNSLGLSDDESHNSVLQPGYVTLFLIIYGFWHVARTCCKPSKVIWRVLYHTVTPCFRPVSFIMNYTGDVLCSLSKPMVDLFYISCYTTTGMWVSSVIEPGNTCLDTPIVSQIVTPLVLVAPYMIRFAQCVRRYLDSADKSMLRSRNIANAIKYASALVVQLYAIFSEVKKDKYVDDKPWFYTWLILIGLATLYMFFWDVCMDWSLFTTKPNLAIREKRLYTRRYLYFCAIFADFVLRFFWISTIIPATVQNPILKYSQGFAWISSVSPALEILRRTIWGFIRLENEHLNNVAGYRRVTNIPLHFERRKEKKRLAKEKEWYKVLLEVIILSVVVLGLSITAIVIGMSNNHHHH